MQGSAAIPLQQFSSPNSQGPFISDNSTIYYKRTQPYVVDYPSRRGPRRNLIKSYIFDWVVVVIILACCAIWFADAPGHKFFRLDDPNLSYPDDDHVVFPSVSLHILYWIPPLLVIVLAQIWIRNVAEFHCTLLCFVTTIALAYMVTTFLMWAVGGLRPNWLASCKPGVTEPPGFPYHFFTASVCTNDHHTVRTAQQSFPSGHAATIFTSYGWLFLYLNAKWKIYDNYMHLWKLIAFFPFIIATWVSFSRVNDAEHTQFDVCAGITIGLFLSIIGYRLGFPSLFGPNNHVPVRLLWDEPAPPVRHISDLHPKHVDFYPRLPNGGVNPQGLPLD